MNEDQIKLAANSIAGLADATGQSFGDILDCLAYESYFLTDKEKQDILNYLASV